jgi:general secretion pathway protein L
MAIISEFKQLFEEWIAAVANANDSAAARVVRQQRISLIEGEDDTFALSVASTPARTFSLAKRSILGNASILGRASAKIDDETPISFRVTNEQAVPSLPAHWKAMLRGSRVEVVMKSEHVLLRSLDFPRQAVEFLDGMIRAQIDRLTPWAAHDAVFGWSPPVGISDERIQLTLAATSKKKVQRFIRLANDLGAASVAVSAEAAAGEERTALIKVLEMRLGRATGGMDLPRILRAVVLSSGLAAAASLLVAAYVGNALDAEQQQLQRRIAERRAALRLSQSDSGGSPYGLLAKRKQTTPSSAIVLEAISRVLPDGTYVTELRIEGDKVQVVGITQDAPSLIRLMEQSPQFTRATFFAPTTRAQNDPGERYHIEAHIMSYFGSGS